MSAKPSFADFAKGVFISVFHRIDADEVARVHAKAFLSPKHQAPPGAEHDFVRLALTIRAYARIADKVPSVLWAEYEATGIDPEMLSWLSRQRQATGWAPSEARLMQAIDEETI